MSILPAGIALNLIFAQVHRPGNVRLGTVCFPVSFFAAAEALFVILELIMLPFIFIFKLLNALILIVPLLPAL